jgi:uncharacterized protein (DUF2252 family)
MATSIILAGREAGQKRAVRRAAVEAFVASYCRAMSMFAKQPTLEMARHLIHREERVRPVHAALRQSERATPLGLLAKYTTGGDGHWRFRTIRPTFWRVTGEEARSILKGLSTYRRHLAPERQSLFDLFRPIDVAFKVVGTGSVGLRDYVVLFEGNGPTDPLFLQVKQETRSAFSPYLKDHHRHQGQRVAEGQRAIQPVSDILLGWTSFDGHDYLVRQLNDHKGSIDLRTLSGGGLDSLAIIAGELLARGHARSGDPCVIHGYAGVGPKIVRAIRDFAAQYADQTEADYGRFIAAIERGRIKVAPSV